MADKYDSNWLSDLGITDGYDAGSVNMGTDGNYYKSGWLWGTDTKMTPYMYDSLTDASKAGLNTDGITDEMFQKTKAKMATNNSRKSLMDGWGGVALGLGNLTLGTLSYLDNHETHAQNMKLMKQKYASNDAKMKQDILDRKRFVAAMGGYNTGDAANVTKPTSASASDLV